MKRLFAIALMLSFGQASVAVAGPTVLELGTRAVKQAARAELPRTTSADATAVRLKVGPQFTQNSGGLAASGLRKRTKLALALAVAAAFGGTLYAIDHRVEDSTPSSRGER